MQYTPTELERLHRAAPEMHYALIHAAGCLDRLLNSSRLDDIDIDQTLSILNGALARAPRLEYKTIEELSI